MIEYPSIAYLGNSEIRKWVEKIPFFLFEKLDGTNIRSEYSAKRGFYKFGTRKGLFGETHRLFGGAIEKIKAQEDALARVFVENKITRATAFFEFFGEHSFAGWHDTREEQDCVLFDVHVGKQGFMPPKQFIKLFEPVVEIPEMAYHGFVTEEIVEQINKGILYGQSFEGIVAKAANPKKGDVIMFKIKNQDWYDKVKATGSNTD